MIDPVGAHARARSGSVLQRGHLQGGAPRARSRRPWRPAGRTRSEAGIQEMDNLPDVNQIAA